MTNYLFQCTNEDCLENGMHHIFEAEIPKCPKCEQGPPFVGSVTLMHLIYYNKTGPIKGYKGRKISIACMPSSELIANPWVASTSYVPLVNCPACKKTEIYKQLWAPDPNNIFDFYNNPNLSEDNKKFIAENFKSPRQN